MERNTSENDLEVAPQSTLEQQSAANSKFVELEDAPVDKTWNIPEGNIESCVAPLTPQTELRRSTRQKKGSKKIFSCLTLLLLTDSGEPKYYYEEALQVEANAE